ncbi:beta-ketoacyl-[acyl-carrier-protein] synthase II [Ehrlichia minasensis]|uniref:3-oxoacyl-[acyl-carrier-protein] synthase 2 n=1 Tax=Ehrlichia minasensis TaxID=1242993 RepID=A0A4Q6I8E0_9RICK|nr:beta-ketoacyl-ACP synthase II [Ehrlichia minasensis]RZB12909.1 beta-ketoacyl-[acyl-carrier-protein] synthase II [Ehrlichia minasensis]CEI84825.1 3-oxoacyl-[acyl-carrier-protein] synthase 2 (EC 2 .3.1.179) [Ehrlichia minasensis]
MTKRRIVITGLGLVTSLGSDVKTVWELLSNGVSGIRKINRFDTSDLDCKIAGQVIMKSESEKYVFNPEDYIPEKDLKKMDNFIHFGIAAATQAVNDSNLLDYKDLDYDRVGVIVGSGIGGLVFIEKTVICLQERGPRRISPFFIPASLINLISGHISIKYGFTGITDAVVTACSTGAQAIGNAARAIQSGEADVIIAGGAEGAVCRLGIAGFAAMKALSTKFNDTPELASRPWDKQRDGFVMGEGAGIVILEDYEHAKKRGAKIYGELLGYGMTSDAYHMSAPHPEGKGGMKAIELALSSAQLNPESINYINAHGTSTPLGDSTEIQAIKSIFKESIYKVPISSTKSSIGHLLGAAGSVEAIFSILAMNTGITPPTLNLYESSEDPQLNLVPFNAQEHKVNHCLSNSFGFGGVNISLVFGKL